MEKSGVQGSMRTIDCHVHLNHYEGMPFKPLEERMQDLLNNMHASAVDYAIVLSSYMVNEDRPSVAQILEATKKHDNIGVVAGYSLDNHNDEDYKYYRQCLKDDRIKGLKLYCGYEHYYPYDKRYQKIYDLCVEYGVPAMFHTGDTFSSKGKLRYSHPLNIDDVAVDNPELKIVMCHLGNPWIQDCEEIIYKNRNVYGDISGFVLGDFTHYYEEFMKEKITELLNYAGEPRYLLYGTDWPISNMDSYLNFVARLDLSEYARELLMHRNSEKLFKL
jgi:predicted TIM-barrel fold metal-dependent hydrolase